MEGISMVNKEWRIRYADKLATAEKALSRIRSGQTVFIGSAAGEPLLLTDGLADMASRFSDIEVIHLAASQKKPKLARPDLRNSFRYKTFYMGRGVSGAVEDGGAEYAPMNLSELPTAMARGIVLVDVALVQVSPPDSLGFCSLGVAVDGTKAAVENADLVIAQVNENMPATLGDSLVPVENIDFLVAGNLPLPEVAPPELDPISATIGRHIADLITDGTTLHFDRGPISAATMRYLDTRRNLGIHTDILTDDIMRLIKSRAVTNRMKQNNKGKTVATMVVGTRALYEEVDTNPYIEILPIDQVNDPFVIGQNDNMVAVLSVQEVELTGLARADNENIAQIRSLPSSADFIDGVRRSRNGFTVLALPSTTPDGLRSRIVAMSIGRGAAFGRSGIHYVVTEYGTANLYGRTISERAVSLISIAHPRFRAQLLEEAKRFNYVGEEQVIPPEEGCVYPRHLEFFHTFHDGTEVFFRPVKPCDARRLQRLFYTLSPEDIRLRYHGTIKALSHEMAQRLAAVDYSLDVPIVGLVGPRCNPMIIAEGRYTYDPATNMGEFDIVVHRDYRKLGIGKFLANFLNKAAYARGLAGVYAEVIQQNSGTMALLDKAWPTATKAFDSGTCTYTVRFPEHEVERPKDSIIVYSGRFTDYSYGEGHPFSPGRARTAMRIIRQEGYLNEPWMRVEEPRMVTSRRLIESHDPDYIEALVRANSGEWDEEFLRYGLGGAECPIFPGLFDYILLYSSATLTGVDLIMEENVNIVFNPLGGFHHASRSAAEGFCYVNDVIIAIDTFLARGFRVAYIDIDAHHCNGVQDAYYRDDRVLTISLHESGKTLYPWTGFETEIGEDMGKGFTINIPLPQETDDEAFETVFSRVAAPAVKKFAPTVVVAVIGADTHKSDPLANLCLTNNGMMAVIEQLRDWGTHLLLLGGGGYNVQATAKAWGRMWAAANRVGDLPDFLLMVGGMFMGGAGVQGAEIVDMRYRVSGAKKNAIMEELASIAQFHEEHTIPLIGRQIGGEETP